MKIKKTIVFALFSLAIMGQTNAQLVGAIKKKIKEKNYVPVFEIEGKKPSSPSTLSMHDKYVGKIVFSDQRLKLDNTSEDLFKTSFNLGDPIYARVFTSNAVENYMLYDSRYGQTLDGEMKNMRASYTIYYYIDDVEIMRWEQNNREPGLSGVNTWQRTVLLPGSKERYDLDSDKQRVALNNLSVGLHKVKVVVWAGEDVELASIKPIAEGEFDLNVTAGAVVKIGKKWSDIKMGDLGKDPKVNNKLTELYSEYLKGKYPEYTIKELKVLSDGYGITNDDYGLPKYRTVSISAYMIDNKSGKCYNFYTFYTQQYAGGGTYSNQFIDTGSPDKFELDCE